MRFRSRKAQTRKKLSTKTSKSAVSLRWQGFVSYQKDICRVHTKSNFCLDEKASARIRNNYGIDG